MASARIDLTMKNYHAAITFVAKSDTAAEELREKLQQIVKEVKPDQIEKIELEFQEETVFVRRDTGEAEDEVTAGLSFDDIFVPKSDSF